MQKKSIGPNAFSYLRQEVWQYNVISITIFQAVAFIIYIMRERKVWTEDQDKILKLLRQQRGERKWANIARLMQQEYGITGRTGKQCRERYHNHLDSSIINTEWTENEEQILYEMHEEIGNKWSIISQKLPGRSDNCVKNHFYSKLRKSVRKLNKLINDFFREEYKPIKESVLSRVIKTTQSKFKNSTKIDQELADFCNDIKNRLYGLSFQEEDNVEDIEAANKLIADIQHFDKDYKKGYKGLKNTNQGDYSPYLKPPPRINKKTSTQSCSSDRSQDSSSFLSSSSIFSSSDLSEYDFDQFHQKGSKTTGVRSGTCSGRNSGDITVKSQGNDPSRYKEAEVTDRAAEQMESQGEMKVQSFAQEYENLIEIQNNYYGSSNEEIHYNNMIYDDTPVIARILGPSDLQSPCDLFEKEDSNEEVIQYKFDKMDL